MPSSLQTEFKRNRLEDLLDKVYLRTAELVKENEDKPKGELEHLQQILPCIAFYEILRDKEGDQEKALILFEKWCFIRIEKMAKWIPICYGNMHPKLVWARSKTLGTGGDCCDFKLYIKE